MEKGRYRGLVICEIGSSLWRRKRNGKGTISRLFVERGAKIEAFVRGCILWMTPTIQTARLSASGSSTLGMLVETLVERVFLVSGVVKTVFCRFKKNKRIFCFSPRTKESKARLSGNFQIASFPYGNAENMFYNFVVLFFSSVRNGGKNSMRVCMSV